MPPNRSFRTNNDTSHAFGIFAACVSILEANQTNNNLNEGIAS